MEPQPYRRRRPALSCVECRRRKIKCDRTDPCAHCIAAKAKCTYKKIYRTESAIRQQTQSINSPPPISTSSALASAGSRLINADKLSEKHSRYEHSFERNAASARPARPLSEEGVSETLEKPEATQSHDQHSSDSLPNTQKFETSVSHEHSHGFNPALLDSGSSILALQAKVHDAQMSLNKERVIKWRQWTGTNSEFATIVDCYMACVAFDTEHSAQNTEMTVIRASIHNLLAECKTLARMTKVGRPSRNLPYSELSLAPPSRVIADTMVNVYFCSFESAYRILHVPTFWTEYQRYWNDPENAPVNLSLKVLLVVAIGSSLSEPDDSDADFRNLTHRWVYAAETWLSGPLEKNRLDINGLQIYCLAILARQVLSIGGDLIWMSMGSLIHRAMQAGLHRDPKHLSQMSVLQAEVRRRLWATILEFAVQSSLDSAMPPRISPDEFDTQAPSNLSDDEIDETTTALQPHPRTIFTTALMQITLLDSLPVRLQVVKTLNGLSSQLSYLDILTLSTEIIDACRTCIEFTRKHEKSEITSFHRNLLDYLVRRFLLPLHCPFASQARTNPLFSYSLKLSVDTAIALTSPEPNAQYERLRYSGGSLFKEGFRSAASTIALGLLAQVESQRIDGTLGCASQHREFLKKTMDEMIAMSLERLKHGETNVKSHMFLSMAMAQVEAIEEGIPCELKIAQSAKDSLELCHSLLRVQVDSLSTPGADYADLPALYNEDASYGLDLDLDYFLPNTDFSGL